MISIIIPCASPMWDRELQLARIRDADEIIRLGQEDPYFHLKRRQDEHYQMGYRQGVVETTIHGWRVMATVSKDANRGVIVKDLPTCDLMLEAAVDWYSEKPNHRELVVANIMPSRQDEFQRALKRIFQFVF